MTTNTNTKMCAVVTGAGGGIGRAVALALAPLCSHLVLVGLNANALEQTRIEASKLAPKIDVAMTDFRKQDEITALINKLTALPRIDTLIHSAGTFSMGPIEAISMDEINDQIHVNFMAPLLISRALLPQLRISQGQIGFINSSAALNPGATTAVYSASKAALRAFAHALRHEVNVQGIRVFTIYPGRTASAMQAKIHGIEGKAYHPERLLQPADVAENVLHALSLPRTAEVTDIHVRPFKKS